MLYETTLGTKGEIILGSCEKKEKDKKASCLLKKGEFVYRLKEKKLEPLFSPEI